MIVAHNLSAMNAQRQYNITGLAKKKSTEKLSSGYKINRAADDAAGLSISEKMRKQVRGLDRGVDNTMEGISLCQVADGALAEVSDMLQRINVLSVQSANGTNSESDRQAIQREVDQIKLEIDRISETTKYNEIPLFRGEGSIVTKQTIGDRSFTALGDIPFSSIQLSGVDLGQGVFDDNSPNYQMGLQAIVNNPDMVEHEQPFDLIFGNGSTSNSSFRVTYDNPNATGPDDATLTKIVHLNEMTSTIYNTEGPWSRDFNYATGDGVEFKVWQTVHIFEKDDYKYYRIAYRIIDTGTTRFDMDVLLHMDTAYNDNDYCEGYYMNGNKIKNTCIYTKDSTAELDGAVDSTYIYSELPESFSIIDVDKSLPFTEKITLPEVDMQKPDAVSIGHWCDIDEWSYYEEGNVESNLGLSTDNMDLGFSLLYKNVFSKAPGHRLQTVPYYYDYGIASLNDPNINGVPVRKDPTILTSINLNYGAPIDIWIQSGCDTGDGIGLKIDRIDTRILGISKLDVSTEHGADIALNLVDYAIRKVNANRSRIGAQQNRLEHTVANESNIVENTQAAESRIRDTDMAKEMVNYSKNNILEQAGQAMMAQANQQNQGVLSLLQ